MMICSSALYLCGIVIRVGGEGNSRSSHTDLITMDANYTAALYTEEEDGCGEQWNNKLQSRWWKPLQIILRDFID